MAINDEWIVAGLVNHRIHVFAADSGQHVRTLVGHTQGVWCLNLVSRGLSPGAVTRLVYKPKPAGSSWRTTSHLGPEADGDDDEEGVIPPTPSGGAPEEGVPKYGSYLRQSDVCNTSTGWGQRSSIVVSGGCDRDLRVWDLTTG